MPVDAAALKQQSSKLRKGGVAPHDVTRHHHHHHHHRSHTEGSSRPVQGLGGGHTHRYREDMEVVDAALPSAVRDRLFDLFGQIEKEFEALYTSNLTLQERVDSLTERLETSSTAGDEKPGRERGDDSAEFGGKAKRASQQLSVGQKIKTTYKASTSRLVSSFRAPNASYSLLHSYRGHRDGVWEVSVSRNNNNYNNGTQHSSTTLIATASADHTARIFSVDTGSCILTYRGHQGSVNAVRFHPSQDLVLSASGDHTAHIWRAQCSFSPPSHTPELYKSLSSGEDDLEASEKEEGTEGEGMDTPTNWGVQQTPVLVLTSHSSVLVAADWVCGGSQVVTASWDRSAILHDAESGAILNVLNGHDQELSDVHAHPTQKLVVTSSKDMTFRLWDFRDSSLMVNVSQGHTQPVTSAVFASGDKVVSGSDDRTVRVWDMRNMRSPIATIRTDSAVNRISVSPGMNIIAIPHDNRHVRLYDINGVRIGRLPRSNRQGHTRMVCAVSWGEDNSPCNLFSCGFDRQVLGWRVTLHNKE